MKPDPNVMMKFLLRLFGNQMTGGVELAWSDPVTGQAAWYDLRVNIEKAEQPPAHSEPGFEQQQNPVEAAPRDVEYGKEWKQ